MQSLEDASGTKEAWIQHVRELEEVANAEWGLQQELQQLRDRDRVQKLISLMSRTSRGHALTWKEGEDFLRKGRDWVREILHPCLREARTREGKSSWRLVEESGLQEVVIKITNTKWASAVEARQEVEKGGLEWGRLGGWGDMVFRRVRSRNLQNLSADAVVSVKVGETLKRLMTGERQLGQEKDPPIIFLPEEDARRTTGYLPFRSMGWKALGTTERDLLDLLVMTAWTANPKIRILRSEIDGGPNPVDLHLWCGKAKQGKVQDQLQLLHRPGVGESKEQGCRPVWGTFPCQNLLVSFGLPNTERLDQWGKEVDGGETHDDQEVKPWIETWSTAVSMAPALLAGLSCRLRLRAAPVLDGREASSTVCIRFLQLRGQRPVNEWEDTNRGLRRGSFQLASEIQKMCWPDARKFENSDIETHIVVNGGGRVEGRILLCNRTGAMHEMEEDMLVGILLAFLIGNSVARGPGVDLRWCPLTQRIGLTSCALTGVTVRRSPFNRMRRDVCFGHQRRGQTEWSLNNKKDPTLRRMIKVLRGATRGSDLLSFLKDRNWGTPGDRRRNPRWDLLRARLQVGRSGGPDKNQTTGLNMGEEHLDRGRDVGAEKVMMSRPASPPAQETGEEEVRPEEESGDSAFTTVEEVRSPHEEVEGGLSESAEDRECSSSEETGAESEDDDEERVEVEEHTRPQPTPSVHTTPGRTRRRGRTRHRVRGGGRAREAKTLLASRAYCSYSNIQRNVESLLHLGISACMTGLCFLTFDRCADWRDPQEVDAQEAHELGGTVSCTSDHRCPGCINRRIGTGFNQKSTGKRLLRFKTLWLSLRGDRTGMRAVLGDRTLQHPREGTLRVQEFRTAWQQGRAVEFMEKLREEGSPDLALSGEELLQAEPRELWTRATGNKGTSYWGLKLPFWASMGVMDHMHIVRTRDPHQVWLARLEEWEWWLHTTARMPRRITIPHPTLVTWNLGPTHWLFSRDWIRRVTETSAPLIMLQEIRLPPGSHRTVKWCLSQICPDYEIWMEEGREAKGPLRDRRDHGFDCGLGLAVITMTHRGVFDSTKTHKIEWLQGSQQRTLGHMSRGRVLVLDL
jgi:hypothetical protein